MLEGRAGGAAGDLLLEDRLLPILGGTKDELREEPCLLLVKLTPSKTGNYWPSLIQTTAPSCDDENANG